jgi:hypothetical protein
VSLRERHVSNALRAEAKIHADDHRARAERADQDVIEERLRRQRGKLLVERQHEHLVDARARKGVDPFGHRRDLRRHLARPQERHRMCRKRQHRRALSRAPRC